MDAIIDLYLWHAVYVGLFYLYDNLITLDLIIWENK